MGDLVVCSNCGSDMIAQEKRPGGWFNCLSCGYSWQPTPVRFGFTTVGISDSVFASITKSVEALAQEFVGQMYNRVLCDYQYYSMLTGEWYETHEGAVDATIIYLKSKKEDEGIVEYFSAGRWIIQDNREREGAALDYSVVCENGDYIAHIENCSLKESEANARLIAKAPELYRFIKLLYQSNSLSGSDEAKAFELLKLNAEYTDN